MHRTNINANFTGMMVRKIKKLQGKERERKKKWRPKKRSIRRKETWKETHITIRRLQL